MTDALEDIKAKARKAQHEANELEKQLKTRSHPMGPLLDYALDSAAAELGATMTERILGVRRPGFKMGRAFVQRQRSAQRKQKEAAMRDRALATVRDLEEVAQKFHDSIDPRFGRSLLNQLANAKRAQRPGTILRRLIQIAERIEDYSLASKEKAPESEAAEYAVLRKLSRQPPRFGRNARRDTSIRPESVEIDIEPQSLGAAPASELSIFVSCGSDPSERESGAWLYESLRMTLPIVPFLWEQKSPGASPPKPLQDRLLQKARDSDAVIGFLHYRGLAQGQLFSLACYDEISAAATSGVPTLVFRTPSVRLTGMVLPHLEVRAIRRISETLPYLRSWLASIRPKSPLWTVHILPVKAKRSFGKLQSAVLICLADELASPRESATLRVRPLYYKAIALSRTFRELLAGDSRTGGPAGRPIEVVCITTRALEELRNIRVPFFKEQDGG